jgi:hypothetical protein
MDKQMDKQLIQVSLPDCKIYNLYKGRQQTRRQSHLMGKSDIRKDVRTKDQLPMVVTTGSSAAVTHTENTEVL